MDENVAGYLNSMSRDRHTIVYDGIPAQLSVLQRTFLAILSLKTLKNSGTSLHHTY